MSSLKIPSSPTPVPDMRKDTNLPQSDFGGPQIAAKSAWSQHAYIAENCNKINKNIKNVPKMAQKIEIFRIKKTQKCMKKIQNCCNSFKICHGQCPPLCPHFLSCLTSALVWLPSPQARPGDTFKRFAFQSHSHVVYNINPFITHAHAGIILCSTQIILSMSYWGRILQAIQDILFALVR